MLRDENLKLGKIAFIAENDGTCFSAKDYLIHYLHQQLKEEWDLEILILNQEKPLSSWLQQCNPIVFNSEFPVFQKLPSMESADLLKSAFNSRKDFSPASPLHHYLAGKLSQFDAFVFIGLSVSTISLLPLTAGKNCAVPILEPGLSSLLSRNTALRFALLECDYYLCHSEKEARIMSSLQPHGEIRTIPLMMDLEFLQQESSKKYPPLVLSPQFSLLMAERVDSTVQYFADQLSRSGIPILVAVQSSPKIQTGSYPIISVDQLYGEFDEISRHIKSAFVFMFQRFFSIFYNLCQLHIPIFVPGIWTALLDGDGVCVLSFGDNPNVNTVGRSHECIPYGYHSYHYYSNYMKRFINEWCVDIKLQNSCVRANTLPCT